MVEFCLILEQEVSGNLAQEEARGGAQILLWSRRSKKLIATGGKKARENALIVA